MDSKKNLQVIYTKLLTRVISRRQNYERLLLSIPYTFVTLSWIM